MRSLYLLQITCFTLLCLIVGTSHAALYKWVDENGQVNYSEKPPAGNTEVETIKPPPKVDSEKALQELRARQEKSGQSDDDKEKEITPEEQEVRKQNCELGRDKLAKLLDNPRVFSTDEQGNRAKLGEDQRQARIKEAREMIQKNCN